EWRGVLENLGRFSEALAVQRQAVECARKDIDPNKLFAAVRTLGHLLQRQGKLDELPAVEVEVGSNGTFVPPRVEPLNHLAWLQQLSLHHVFATGWAVVGPEEIGVYTTNRKIPGVLDTLADAYAEAGESGKAAATQADALALLRQTLRSRRPEIFRDTGQIAS